MSYELRCASYILGNFYLKTKDKYKCTNIKLQQLVTIAHLRKLYMTGYPLSDSSVMITPYGFKLQSIAKFFPIEICGDYEARKIIRPEEIRNFKKTKLGDAYDGGMQFVMDEDDKWLRETFCRFGAYSTKDLGNMINKMAMIFYNRESCVLSWDFLRLHLKEYIDKDMGHKNSISNFIKDGLWLNKYLEEINKIEDWSYV